MEPSTLILTLALLAPLQAAVPPGAELLVRATRLLELENPEESRARTEAAIEAFFGARAEAQDLGDDRFLRDAGALAYKLRSLPAARRAWDAARRFRERTLAPDSMELQNARGNASWIGEQMGLVAEARVLEEAILASLERSLPADHEALVMARANLGDTLLQLGEPQRALELFQLAADVRRAKHAPEHPARQRAEIDLAAGLAGVARFAEADDILSQVLAAAPGASHALRVRAAAALVLARAVHGEEGPFRAAASAYADELERAHAAQTSLAWREREIRAAELRPFGDLLLSAAEGLGVRAPDAALLARTALAAAVVGPASPHAALRRVERSRVAGDGADRRLVTEERLVAACLPAQGAARWIDLGDLGGARALVERRHVAAGRGSARPETEAVAEALFAPLARALGDPAVLRVALDDVAWALPLHVLELRAADGRAIRVEAVLRASPRAAERPPGGDWLVLGDPTPRRAAGERVAEGTRRAQQGAAAAYLTVGSWPAPDPSLGWGSRFGVTPERGADASLARLIHGSPEAAGLVLVASVWSAPSAVPCLTTPRPLAADVPLAAAMAREDVVGGSSPADLVGLLLAGHAESPEEDGRVAGAPTAADLREIGSSGGRVVLAQPPRRAQAVGLARDVEALARAFVEAGFTDVCLALEPVGDVERLSLPPELEAAIPRARPRPSGALPGPWLRVRALR